MSGSLRKLRITREFLLCDVAVLIIYGYFLHVNLKVMLLCFLVYLIPVARASDTPTVLNSCVCQLHRTSASWIWRQNVLNFNQYAASALGA